MPRRNNQRRRARRRAPRASNTINLVNFGQTNRRTIVAAFSRDLSSVSTVAITIGRRLTGSIENPLLNALFANDLNGWPLENIRVLSIKVVFDCRGLGASGFNARPRVGAFMSGDTLSAIDETKISVLIETFGGVTISPNQSRTINVRVGPEFAVGRFGETGANTLVVYQRGFLGFARIIVRYQVLGFPATRVILSSEEASEEVPTVPLENSVPIQQLADMTLTSRLGIDQ